MDMISGWIIFGNQIVKFFISFLFSKGIIDSDKTAGSLTEKKS